MVRWNSTCRNTIMWALFFTSPGLALFDWDGMWSISGWKSFTLILIMKLLNPNHAQLLDLSTRTSHHSLHLVKSISIILMKIMLVGLNCWLKYYYNHVYNVMMSMKFGEIALRPVFGGKKLRKQIISPFLSFHIFFAIPLQQRKQHSVILPLR